MASRSDWYLAIWLPITSSGFLKVMVSVVDFALDAGLNPRTVKSSASTRQPAASKAATRGAEAARKATFSISASA